METVVNLIYSVSPRHTDEYYAQKAREAAAIAPYRICFKDVGGLLTPERARTLLPAILTNAGAVPVEYHAHCNNGLATLCYIEAVKLGITSLHTAVPPLANGSSQPSILNVARNLRALGYTPVVHDEEVKPVEEHFTAVAKAQGLAIGKPFAYDESQYLHQVPGGVISNLRHQLRLVGKEDKLPETLEEAARVRADFGYPIMVTPLSQFVVSQAAINVIVGERYKEVTDQVIQYALGIWGKEATEIMDAERQRQNTEPRSRQGLASLATVGSEFASGTAKVRRDYFRRRTPAARLRRPRRGRCADGRRRAQAATRRQTIAVATDRTTQQEERIAIISTSAETESH